jgi:V/A-type H+-transporting ATPase subunit I
MSRKMSHLQIIALKTDMLATIRELGELGCVHIDKITETPECAVDPLTADAAMVRKQEELRLKLLQVNGLIDTLGIKKNEVPVNSCKYTTINHLLPAIERLLPVVQELANRRDKLRSERELLPRFLDTMQKLLPLFLSVVCDPDYVSFGVLVNRNHADVLNILANEIAQITEGCAETAVGPLDAATQAMFIAVPGPTANAIGALLDQHDVSRLRLPPGFDSTSPESAIAALNNRLRAIPDESAALDRQINELAERWKADLVVGCNCLQDELEIYQILPYLGQTDMTFVLAGWVPDPKVPEIQAALEQQIGERLIILETTMTEELKKRAPVMLSNPGIAQPFESLVHLFSTPRYEEFDPTMLMAFFMPLFFGMMLGDIGYGVLLLGIMLFLRQRFKSGMFRDLVTILAMGASWSIVFGILFGEMFGTLGEEIGLHPILFDRVDSNHLVDLLALTLSVGAAHILLGLLIGLWEGVREKSKHHLLERGGRLLGLIALFLLTGILVDVLPGGFMTPAIALLIVGTVFLASGLGKIGIIVAPIEMIGLVGNILSYLRIAAIGLSSVYLALVASEIAGVIGSIIVGLIIAVLLHALNLVLGMFSPTIQSLRLHYVEFFRHFYVGGGRLYEPYQSHLFQQR